MLDAATIANARRLDDETPPPEMVRVAGILDMVRLTSNAFELVLDDGTRARGVLVEGNLKDNAPAPGSRVLVQGQAIFRPSRRLLRIDARSIEPGADASGFWSKIPPPRRRTLDPRAFRRPQTASTGVSSAFGAWPGDESDEEWAAIIEGLD